MQNGPSIKDLIRHAKRELRESAQERRTAGEDALFRVQTLTIEVNVVVTETREVEGGLDFKVVTAGGSKSYEEQQVHKITVVLGAIPPGSDPTDYNTDLDEE